MKKPKFIFIFLHSYSTVSCLLLMVLIVPFSSIAQISDPTERYIEEEISEREFDRENWRKNISDIDYSKDLRKKKEKEEQISESESRDAPSFDFSFNSSLSTILLIIIGVILLVVLLRYALGNGKIVRNRKIDNIAENLSLQQIEENLEANDPTNFIEKAIQAGNYRLALRLYYLKVIRELSLSGAIEWKRDKTNRTYLNELKEENWRISFRNITLAFERIWYGNRVLEESEFLRLQPELDQLLNDISSNEK